MAHVGSRRRGARSVQRVTPAIDSRRVTAAIAELREQTVMVVAFLEQAERAVKRGDSKAFGENFTAGLEAARSARQRARAIDEVVSPKRGRRA